MEVHLLGEVLTLLLVSCGVALFAEWLKQPYTIALVLVGLALALTKIAPHIVISEEVIFTLVLPPLLFHGALHMDLEHLRDNWKSILLLAVPGVVVSTFLIGFLAHWLFQIPLAYGLLFGALITPTDPLSVLSILKKVGAPERLRTILEGESLFNDGTGVVLFTIILGMISGGHEFSLGASVGKFFLVAGGGTLIGLVVGFIAYKLFQKIDSHLIEVSLTVVVAFGTPLLAESLHLSGMIAVVVAGLILGNYGRVFSMSEKTREAVESFWEVIEFIVNSLIFLAIGVELQALTGADFVRYAVPIALGIAMTLFARAAVIYPFLGVLNKVLGEKLPAAWGHVFSWGGLKGAIPIALVVGLSADFEYKKMFLTVSFGIVLFSLVVQGFTMKPLVKKLRLTT